MKYRDFGFNNDFFIAGGDGCYYFRLFGYGLWFATYKSQPVFFSERYGYHKVLSVGFGRFRILRPHP